MHCLVCRCVRCLTPRVQRPAVALDSSCPTRVIGNASLGAQASFFRRRSVVICSPLEAHCQRVQQVAIRRGPEPELHSSERIGGPDATQLAYRVNADGTEPAGTYLADVAKGGQVFARGCWR